MDRALGLAWLVVLVVGIVVFFAVPVVECASDADCSVFGPYGCVASACNCTAPGLPHPFRCDPHQATTFGTNPGFWVVLIDVLALWTALLVRATSRCPGGAKYDKVKERYKVKYVPNEGCTTTGKVVGGAFLVAFIVGLGLNVGRVGATECATDEDCSFVADYECVGGRCDCGVAHDLRCNHFASAASQLLPGTVVLLVAVSGFIATLLLHEAGLLPGSYGAFERLEKKPAAPSGRRSWWGVTLALSGVVVVGLVLNAAGVAPAECSTDAECSLVAAFECVSGVCDCGYGHNRQCNPFSSSAAFPYPGTYVAASGAAGLLTHFLAYEAGLWPGSNDAYLRITKSKD